MRLIPRHRQTHRAKAPRIQISQEEITADLHYRGGSRPHQRDLEIARRGVAR
jgi:hypothetical protein